AYRQILRLHPADAQARFSFGRFLTRKGAHGEARALLAAVVEAEPGGQEAWLWLARALQGLGDAEGARAALRRLLALDPGHQEAKALLLQLGFAPKAPALAPLLGAANPGAAAQPLPDAEAFLRGLAVPDPLARYRR
ncbi:MAG: tetratricopeptide repeat protein, partial [Caulobacteraceae bacterium]|nr:tetratricopeptide repeat protein [Caulobacteraceae bacterium]